MVGGTSQSASIEATTAIASAFSERAPAAGEPAAEEVHPLFERHGEPATDEIVELPVALAGEGSQSAATGCGELLLLVFSRGHVRIRADGVENVSWKRGACRWKRGLAASAREPAAQPDRDPALRPACWR